MRAVRRRCPRCGAGPLFRGWFGLVDECPGCGWRYGDDDAFFLGAFTLNLGAVLVAIGAYIGIGFALTVPDPPIPVLAVGGVVVAVAVPLLFYPLSQTLWAATLLWMRGEYGRRS